MKKLLYLLFFLPSMSLGADYSNQLFRSANDITRDTLNDARLSVRVTTQTNTFNGANQLLRLNGSGQIPAGLISPSVSQSSQAFALFFPTASAEIDQHDLFTATATTWNDSFSQSTQALICILQPLRHGEIRLVEVRKPMTYFSAQRRQRYVNTMSLSAQRPRGTIRSQ